MWRQLCSQWQHQLHPYRQAYRLSVRFIVFIVVCYCNSVGCFMRFAVLFSYFSITQSYNPIRIYVSTNLVYGIVYYIVYTVYWNRMEQFRYCRHWRSTINRNNHFPNYESKNMFHTQYIRYQLNRREIQLPNIHIKKSNNTTAKQHRAKQTKSPPQQKKITRKMPLEQVDRVGRESSLSLCEFFSGVCFRIGRLNATAETTFSGVTTMALNVTNRDGRVKAPKRGLILQIPK